jgi:hypothetical protein
MEGPNNENFLRKYNNPLVSAFRTVFGRQTTLLKIIEDWKKVIRRK